MHQTRLEKLTELHAYRALSQGQGLKWNKIKADRVIVNQFYLTMNYNKVLKALSSIYS